MSQIFEATSLYSKAALTKGKTYIVKRISVGTTGVKYYHIVNDKGDKAKYNARYFLLPGDLEGRSL